MKYVFLFLLATFSFLSGPAYAEDLLPKGWRVAHEAVAGEIDGDLNGDGAEDRAVLVTDGNVTKLLAFVRGKDGFSIFDLLTTHHAPSACGIELLPPGKYRTACGKGSFDCAPGEPETIATTGRTLAFHDENVEIVYLFKPKGVLKIWLSD